MKIISLFIILFLFLNIALADELSVPFSCYPQELQKKFAQYKMKLDLNPAKRNRKSWGYLKNEGASYIIFTYKPVTLKEFQIVLKIVREVEREQNNRK